MATIINQAYYNWFKGYRREWFKSWEVYMYSRQLASGGQHNRNKKFRVRSKRHD